MTSEGEAERAAAAGLNADDPRFEQAVFGREVEHWLENDPVASYLIDRAKGEIEEVKELLLTARTADAVAELQARAAVCTRFKAWLAEAVQTGRDAIIALQQEQDTKDA